MRLDLILFVGIRYSMRYLLSNPNNYAWPANWRYAVSEPPEDMAFWTDIELTL